MLPFATFYSAFLQFWKLTNFQQFPIFATKIDLLIQQYYQVSNVYVLAFNDMSELYYQFREKNTFVQNNLF